MEQGKLIFKKRKEYTKIKESAHVEVTEQCLCRKVNIKKMLKSKNKLGEKKLIFLKGKELICRL